MNHKPFAPSAEKNRHDILSVLKTELPPSSHVLELASGTGQHASHFAQAMPHLSWQPSDLSDKIQGIQLWIDESGCDNIEAPLALDISNVPWPELRVDACYAANTLHIISWELMNAFFEGCASVLKPAGKLIVYGPYSFDGEHTAPSNQQFDLHLKSQDPKMGIRDMRELDRLACQHGFAAARLVEMLANNFVAVWEKIREK
ncbi:MAG: DUF938 domain-containing protein [Granulosicoccaceae bacterium]